MSPNSDDHLLADLAEAIRRQTEVCERISQSLIRLEAISTLENERREAERREQAQDRAEARVRMRQLDARMGGTGILSHSSLLSLLLLSLVVFTAYSAFTAFRH